MDKHYKPAMCAIRSWQRAVGGLLPTSLGGLWLAVGLLLLWSPSQGLAAVRIASPPDNAWVTESRLYLAGTVDPSSTQVTLKGVKIEAGQDAIKVDNGAFGAMLSLSGGLNTITVSDGKAQNQVKIFLSPAADGKGALSPPPGFKRFYIHRNSTALDCKECHRLKGGSFDFKRIIPARSNCTTGQCHADKGKAPHVHGPVGAGVCISCHNPHGSFAPMEMARTGPDLCLVCHQAKQEEFKQPVIHPPVKDGCTDCHDPHQSKMRFQLRGDGTAVSSLCFTCHEETIFTKPHRHGPVGAGDCIACHLPHAGTNPKLLIAPQKKGELCFKCHEDRKESFTQKNIHPPVAEDCGKCHDPHSSDHRFQLHQEGTSLCESCHAKTNAGVFKDIATAKVKHKPVAEGRCPDCHNVHSSNYRPLLKNNMEALCLGCHVALGDVIQGSAHRHGPAKTGDCTSCHKVHGSDFAQLMIRYFPPNFYSEYQPDQYDLCFGCHNKDIAKQKFTTTLTNFRDGQYNLHYFHVNMKKGRTCTACHDPHASNQSKHIRYEVPFGSWSYPINFTKRPTGGTCIVGCHAPKTYDRKDPQVQPSR
ncbi:MAG: hypothetical protein OEV91_09770 [Desulfobulbaceae bacterium]|nr:hypothetical protein [Desulfobulbaceae bacterium]